MMSLHSSLRNGVIFLMGLSCVSLVHVAHAQTATTATIGFAGPLSNAIVNTSRQGAEIAVEMANEQETKNGKAAIRFILDAQDDKNSVNLAEFIAQYFVTAKVIGVVGHFGAAPAIASAPVYEKAGIAQIMFTPSAAQFTRLGYQTAFRALGSAENTAAYMAEAVVSVLKGKRVAIITNETPYGKSLADSVEREMQLLSKKVVRRIVISATTSDFNAALQTMQDDQIDVIIFCPNITQIQSFALSVKRLNIAARIVLTAGATDNDLFSDGKGGNLYAMEPGMPKAPCARWSQFQKKYVARYGEKPTTHARYAFDATDVLIDAARRSDLNDARSVLANLRKENYAALGGTIAFDPSGNLKRPTYGLYHAEPEGWTLVRSFPAAPKGEPGCS